MSPEQRMQADVIRAASVAWVEDPLVPLAAAEAAINVCDEFGDDHPFDDGPVSATTDLYRTSARSSARWRRRTPVAGRTAVATSSACRRHRLLPCHRCSSCDGSSRWSVFLALSGDITGARAEAEAGLSIASECNLLHHPFTSGVFLAVGEARRLSGAPDEAIAAVERGLELASVNRRRNFVAVATGSLAGLFVDLGRAPDVLALLDQHRTTMRHRPPTTPAAMLATSEARACSSPSEITERH